MVHKIRFGIYRLQEPVTDQELNEIESAYNIPVDIVSVYRAWNRCAFQDDAEWLERIKHIPRDILLTWEPWMNQPDTDRPYDQPDFALKEIISGRYDAYIGTFGRELGRFPQRVYLRIMHEMNGNWYPWCGTVNGNSPQLYLAAWNHIRDLVEREVRSGIKWVWSPYAHSYPNIQSNSLEQYFPGDEKVDRIAIDGYNWGNTMEWSSWQSLEDIFSGAYDKLLTITSRPLMIGETGSAEEGGDKTLWIEEAAESLRTRFRGIEALVWFDINKECDWRIASSPGSLSAFNRAAASFREQSDGS